MSTYQQTIKAYQDYAAALAVKFDSLPSRTTHNRTLFLFFTF